MSPVVSQPRGVARRARAHAVPPPAWPLALALLLAGCGPREAAPHPGLLLISLDTLRRDALGPPAPGQTSATPNLDAFARDAVVFAEARSPMPFTLPSHLSLFTGLRPDVHGVEHPDQVLPDQLPTLPELLSAAGYRTAGLASNHWMNGAFGFARGFDSYEKLKLSLFYSATLRSRALAQLDAWDTGRPWFLFLHDFDAHSDFAKQGRNLLPYYVPPAFRPPGAPEPTDPRFCRPGLGCATDYLTGSEKQGLVIAEDDIALLRQLYAAGIAAMDQQLGLLFDGLRERGIYDDTLIVISSDHGEEFGEHGRYTHSQPYEESVAVPLMIKLPGGRLAGTRVEGLVDTVDLLPTILELAGVDGPAGFDQRIQGQSLVPALAAGATTRPFSLSQDRKQLTRHALVVGHEKLVHDAESGASELYDLIADPGEQHDLHAERPERTAELLCRLGQVLRLDAELAASLGTARDSGTGLHDVSPLSEEEREELRRLGYVR